LAVVEGQIAGRKLLVAEESTVFAAIKCQVSHESTRSIVHENSLLSIGGSPISSHVENNVLKRGCLSHLPVDTGSNSNRHRSGINNEVTDLAEEVVLVCVPGDDFSHVHNVRELETYQLTPPSAYGSLSIKAIPENPAVALMVGIETASPMNWV
jgi:hypothetical protein